MQEVSPVLGIALLQRFAPPEECEALLRSTQMLDAWRPAKVGEYEDNRLVVSTVDPLATTAEVTASFDEAAAIITRVRAASVVVARRRFGLKVRSFSKSSISRYAPGAEVGRHRDTTVFSTDRLITVILYLNDGFDGGELVFPDLGLTYSPSQGDVAIFLSEYFHGVTPVSGGYRYCLIQFGQN